ncbi:hypothetical protein ACH4Q7_22470 [Streptomyces roseolus]|uniref:hypothetical protein n=1 Tax=Streptomyces roseolus TaxID=67358 RepID=UPI00378A7FFC
MAHAPKAVITAYAVIYLAEVVAGTLAAEHGDGFSAAVLFAASTALLAGIYRECRHTARELRLAALYRLAAARARGLCIVEDPAAEAALPAGCVCETWWATLGADHSLICPANPHTRL